MVTTTTPQRSLDYSGRPTSGNTPYLAIARPRSFNGMNSTPWLACYHALFPVTSCLPLGRS
eukprot:8988215-Prorocentrum_lima.AAC.1